MKVTRRKPTNNLIVHNVTIYNQLGMNVEQDIKRIIDTSSILVHQLCKCCKCSKTKVSNLSSNSDGNSNTF